MRTKSIFVVLLISPHLRAQNEAGLPQILERLERLEQQNRALAEEVESLKRQLAGRTVAPATPLEDRLSVQEKRTEELAQAKVGASQHLPISITGMVLFNSFLNSRFNGAQDNPTTASLNAVPRTGGGTLRQTVIGLRFQSPNTVLGAQINGAFYLDFFANPPREDSDRGISVNLNRLARLRVATVEMDWGSTLVMVGQDKPIISPREPNSLAQMGVSPLTNAGNPWLWQPQVRVEHQWKLATNTSFRGQLGVFQTAESAAILPTEFEPTLESSRPGWEGRFALRHALGEGRYLELAPGFHLSTTHVAGTSVPSRVYSFDWSMAPVERIEFSGMFFGGQNTANLGTLRQGFKIISLGNVVPVRSLGGWAQISFTATPRLTFNLYSGQQDDRDRDLNAGGVGKNFAYAGNALYRIAPNVILGFEMIQIRTSYVGVGKRLNNHYDLALAYQF